MINKNLIIQNVVDIYKQELKALVASAFEAKEAATNNESKAENKYDTRGLEASYLAGAQAKRASELKDLIYQLEKLPLVAYSAESQIGTTAVVHTEVDGEEEKVFFLIPQRGGLTLEIGNDKITVVSIQSPIGKALLNKKIGDFFPFRSPNGEKEFEILKTY